MNALLFGCFLLAAQAPSFDAVFRDGLIALNRNELSIAREKLHAAAGLRPESGEVWAALAQTLLKLREPEAADEAARKARSLAGSNQRVLRALIFYYSGRSQTPQVIEVARAAIALNDGADLRSILGKAYLAERQFKEGIAELREAIRLDGSREAYHFDLAQALLQAEDFHGAAEVLQAGCKMVPNSAQLQLALGVAYYGQRRFPEAIDRFLQTTRLAPEVEQPYAFLGKLLGQAGDRLPEMAGAFQTFLKNNPKSRNAQFLYAKLLLALDEGDTAEAERLLRLASSGAEGLWEANLELGVLLAKQRKYPEAAEELQRSIELNPREASSHYHLARVYDRLGNASGAAEERSRHEQLLGRSGVK